MGKQKIGISSEKLDLIEATPPIAYLPGLPRVVAGVLQIRGNLLAAVDVAGWFGIEGGGGGPCIPTGLFRAIAEHGYRDKFGLTALRYTDTCGPGNI